MPYSKFTGKDIADGIRQIISGKSLVIFQKQHPLTQELKSLFLTETLGVV